MTQPAGPILDDVSGRQAGGSGAVSGNGGGDPAGPAAGLHTPLGPSGLPGPDSALVRLLSSALVERQRFRAYGPGPNLYGGRRDLYGAVGYPRQLTSDDYRDFYERGDVAARLVEFYPQSTWLPAVAVNEIDDPDTQTEFERIWIDFDRRLNVIADIFMRADILACTYRYSVIVIGAPGDLSTELPRGNGRPDAIKYLTVLGEDRAAVTRLVGQDDTDENGLYPGATGYIDPVSSSRFGLPLTYCCKFGVAINYFTSDGSVSSSTGSLIERDVHWSRVWHMANGTLDNRVYGQSMYRRVANALIDYQKLRAAYAESAWRTASPKIHANMDPTMMMLPGEEEQLREAIDRLRHDMEDVVRTRGVDIKMLSSPVGSMEANVHTLLRVISAAWGIPARVMTGSEEAKAAGTQDDRHTNDRQTERWGYYATPQLGGFIGRLADYNYMPRPKDLTIVWPEIEEHTESEKAAIASQLALANKNQTDARDTPIRTSAELRDELWGLRDPIIMPDVAPNDNQNLNDNPMTDNPTVDSVRAASQSPDSRIIIIGGPRRGKSTIARNLRTSASAIPTYCGDPVNLVKEPEDGVTYLPANLSWSESSAYIAENWLTQPGPWCCEGVAMARAVRKMVIAGKTAILDGVDIVVLIEPYEGASETAGQAIMAKGVMTVWAEVADLFPQARTISTGRNSANKQSQAQSATVANRKLDTWEVTMPAGRRAIASKKNHKSSPRFSFKVW